MRVVEVFESLQGEGVWAGVPMTFVRLAGCNAPDLGLGCVEWCDTRYAWSLDAGRERDPEELAAEIRLPRCCVTGGEPLLHQEEVARFVVAAHRRGVLVHLETNGTIAPEISPPVDWITVSPKPPDFVVASGLAAAAKEVKLVLDASLGSLGVAGASVRLRRVVESFGDVPVCIQPEASGEWELARMAVQVVLANPTWRLSLQLHRILGLR